MSHIESRLSPRRARLSVFLPLILGRSLVFAFVAGRRPQNVRWRESERRTEDHLGQVRKRLLAYHKTGKEEDGAWPWEEVVVSQRKLFPFQSLECQLLWNMQSADLRAGHYFISTYWRWPCSRRYDGWGWPQFKEFSLGSYQIYNHKWKHDGIQTTQSWTNLLFESLSTPSTAQAANTPLAFRAIRDFNWTEADGLRHVSLGSMWVISSQPLILVISMKCKMGLSHPLENTHPYRHSCFPATQPVWQPLLQQPPAFPNR